MTRGYETLPKHRYRPEPFSNLVSVTETKMQSLYGQEQGDVILEIQQFYGNCRAAPSAKSVHESHASENRT